MENGIMQNKSQNLPTFTRYLDLIKIGFVVNHTSYSLFLLLLTLKQQWASS